MLDFAHSLILRSVANGDQDDSPALQTLIATGLVERGDDGRVSITPAGRVALEDDDDGGALEMFAQSPWIPAGFLAAIAGLFMVVNAIRGNALLNGTQLWSLAIVGVGLALLILYRRRAAG